MTGCATYDVNQYDNIDKNNKTIVINGNPNDFNGYFGDINQAFRKAGWKVFAMQQQVTNIDKSPVRADGMNVTANYKARYRLDYSWKLSTKPIMTVECWQGIEYSISIIDYYTAQEAYSMSGISCASNVVDQLKLWLASPQAGG